MDALPHDKSRADPHAAPSTEVAQARYLDALLTGMDQVILAELISDRSKFAYEAIRRVMVRMIEHNAARSPEGELGAARVLPRGETPGPAELLAAAWQEGVLLDGIEQRIDARLADYAAPHYAGETLTAETVQDYLRSRIDDAARITEFRVLAGGRSKQTILLRVTGLPDIPPDLVIRRDLPAGPVGTTVTDEFELLQALNALGAPVPRPYLLESDPAVLGTPMMLMQRIPGALIGDIATPPPNPAAVLGAARALGRLHALPVAALQATLPPARRMRLSSMLRAEIETMRDTWNAQARDVSATMTLAFDWLLAHVDPIPSTSCLVHSDYSFHNILYVGDDVSAVLDWELARIGHPEEDLGYIRGVACEKVPWPDFLQAYREAGGLPSDPVAVSFFAMVGLLRLIHLLHRARVAFETKLTDDMQLIDVVLFHLPKFIQRVSVELRQVLARP